jgi:hypothetical protein
MIVRFALDVWEERKSKPAPASIWKRKGTTSSGAVRKFQFRVGTAEGRALPGVTGCCAFKK